MDTRLATPEPLLPRPLLVVTALLSLLGVLGCAGCVRVKPYEREAHSRKTMQDRDAADEKLEGHVHEYREGSVGGSGVGGGGCGCN